MRSKKFQLISILLSCILFLRCARSEDLFGDYLPISSITPGDIRTTDSSIICDLNHKTDEIRKGLTTKVKEQAYRNYGMSTHNEKWCNTDEGCELDHLISLELGGSNDIKNIWPQPYIGAWNAHMKDKLENRLHKMVCSGELTLTEAQTKIRTNWINAYKEIFNSDRGEH